MFCQNCGAENKDNAVFCENCGERLEKEEMIDDTFPEENLPAEVVKEAVEEGVGNKKKRPVKKILIAAGALLICAALAVGGLTAYKAFTKETYCILGNLTLDKEAYGYSAQEGNCFEGLDEKIANESSENSDYAADSWLKEHIVNDAKAPEGMSPTDWEILKGMIDYSCSDLVNDEMMVATSNKEICKDGNEIEIICVLDDNHGGSEIEKLEKKYNCIISLAKDVEEKDSISAPLELNGWPQNYKTADDILKEKRDVLERIEFKSKNEVKDQMYYANDYKIKDKKMYYATEEKDPEGSNAYIVCTYKVTYENWYDDGTEYYAVYTGPFTEGFEESDLEEDESSFMGDSVMTFICDEDSEKSLLNTLKTGTFSDTSKYTLEKIDL